MVEPVKLADEPVTRARTMAVALWLICSRLSCSSVAAAAVEQAHMPARKARLINLDIVATMASSEHVSARLPPLQSMKLRL
jgi:hypothetical protein